MNLPDDTFSSLLTPDYSFPLINIGCGEDRTIRELAVVVHRGVGFDGEISWDNTKPDGMPRKLLDVSRLRALGWSPRVDLETGIKTTYEWYLNQ
jgi:GDP-L-fucose synthase